MRRFRMAALAALALTTLLSSPGSARADEKQACLAASDKAQQLKLDGKLLGAREQLLICERGECPAIVRQDCAQWLNEVMASLPSVVIGARDYQGHDVFAVRVSIDGALITEKLDGKPVPIDPGAHSFRYETAGVPPVTEQVLVREGEKNRALTVTFPAPPGAQTAPPQQPQPHAQPQRQPDAAAVAHSSGGVSPFAWVFTGVGVIALGSALALDLWANNDVSDLKGSCAPNCTSAQTDPIRTKWTLAGVSLGVGIVAIGVATYFFVTGPSRPAADAHASVWRFDFKPARGGGVAELGARF